MIVTFYVGSKGFKMFITKDLMLDKTLKNYVSFSASLISIKYITSYFFINYFIVLICNRLHKYFFIKSQNTLKILYYSTLIHIHVLCSGLIAQSCKQTCGLSLKFIHEHIPWTSLQLQQIWKAKINYASIRHFMLVIVVVVFVRFFFEEKLWSTFLPLMLE